MHEILVSLHILLLIVVALLLVRASGRSWGGGEVGEEAS